MRLYYTSMITIRFFEPQILPTLDLLSITIKGSILWYCQRSPLCLSINAEVGNYAD